MKREGFKILDKDFWLSTYDNSLKRELLYFDNFRINVHHTFSEKASIKDKLFNRMSKEQKENFIHKENEIGFLIENKLIQNYDDELYKKVGDFLDREQRVGVGIGEEYFYREVEEVSKGSKTMEELLDGTTSKLYFKSKGELYSNAARIACLLVREESDNELFPLISYDGLNGKYLDNKEVTKTNAIRVILKKLPIPNENTPWEQILEFKNVVTPKNRTTS
jgi:hypothetical protein